MSELTQTDLKLVHSLFSQFTVVSSKDIDLIGSFLKRASYKKDEIILAQGQKDTRINLVTKGIVHLFTYIDGEVFTINLSLPGMIFNSLDSYIFNHPTSEIQLAISDVNTLYLEKSDVETLMKSNNTFCYICKTL